MSVCRSVRLNDQSAHGAVEFDLELAVKSGKIVGLFDTNKSENKQDESLIRAPGRFESRSSARQPTSTPVGELDS